MNEHDKHLDLIRQFAARSDDKHTSVKVASVDGERREDGGYVGEIETRDGRRHRVVMRAVLGALGVAAVDRIARAAALSADPVLVLAAAAAGAKVRNALIDHDLGYLDLAGNCHVELDGGNVTVHVEGRRDASKTDEVGALRGAGYRVLFALLAAPGLLEQTVRELGRAARASRHTAQTMLARLRDEGLLVRTGRSRHLFAPGGREACIDRFATGWADVLRERLIVGRYRLREQDPEAVARTLEQKLHAAEVPFGFGAARGSVRWGRYLQSDETTIHVSSWTTELQRDLGAAPDRSGPLLVLQTMTTLDLESGMADTAHPLLVHAELARSPEPRAREAARLLLEHITECAG